MPTKSHIYLGRKKHTNTHIHDSPHFYKFYEPKPHCHLAGMMHFGFELDAEPHI